MKIIGLVKEETPEICVFAVQAPAGAFDITPEDVCGDVPDDEIGDPLTRAINAALGEIEGASIFAQPIVGAVPGKVLEIVANYDKEAK